jgi:molybdopterin-containing oxidoreductase family iron-sulfur binding subunit
MSASDPKHYWRNWKECEAGSAPTGDEFPNPPDEIKAQFGRRDFLKAAGFVFAGTVLTGCTRAPVEKAIPYLVQPEEITPGRAAWYASTCAGCSAGCGLLVKTRDGRPIKLEGNPDHLWSRGGLCAVGQASVLGLYDSQRLKNPLVGGRDATWAEADQFVAGHLSRARSDGAVRFLSGTVTSPTLRASIQRFLSDFKDARHVTYDPLSSSAILDAHEQTHGVRTLPRYDFDRAEVIVSVDADFLGTWISPVEFTRAYVAGRSANGVPPRFSYHVQFESRLSLTGAKADRRFAIAPGEARSVLVALSARVAQRAGVAFAESGPREGSVPLQFLDEVASRLWESRGRSLVVCGSQDLDAQILCNLLNHLLANYGQTLDLEQPSYQKQGNDRELRALLDELDAGKVAALFIYGVNPVYDHPESRVLASALERVPLVVSFAERLDETASLAHLVAPDHHPLESWGDAEAVTGVVSLLQPTVNPLGNTRSVLESLAAWTGAPRSAYDTIREHWHSSIFARQKREKSFQEFWDHSVHNGFAEVEPARIEPRPFDIAAVRPASPQPSVPDEFALVLYPKVSMLDGRHAHNAWLHELPDPISKVAWDNYACLSPTAATRLGVQDGDVVRIEVADSPGAEPLELPALVQPGQHDRVVAVALGYGRKGTDRFAHVGPQWLLARTSVGADGRVGKNAAPLAVVADGRIRYERGNVRVTRTGGKQALASTQEHHSLSTPRNVAPREVRARPAVQETTLAALLSGRRNQDAKGGHDARHDLWPDDHPYTGHRWAMAIDLSACTGCSACVVACLAENNIPVVGKDEVRRQREMHWLRVDRYYAGHGASVEVAFQPMMCQQCDTAPCETVCPVLATVHSEEGLNQQIYNRCVGTRYCANNCPYKVRRFNWFDYPREDRLQNLVLNPDVTVRSRGVMEKCTFCVQRIQEAKLEAKRVGEKFADGAVRTACEQSCPAGAIVFGDLNDPASRIAKLATSARAYRVLEEFNFRPAVHYLKIVRNRPEGGEEESHG